MKNVIQISAPGRPYVFDSEILFKSASNVVRSLSESSPHADAIPASSLLSHLYLTPVLVELVRGGVPDYLNHGPLHASDLANAPD